MRRVGVAFVIAAIVAGPLLAAPPERTPRPEPRPAKAAPPPIQKTETGFVQLIPSARTPSGKIAVFFGGGARPEPRPARRAPAPQRANPAPAPQRATTATQITRPPAVPAKMGRICGSRAILGRELPPVPGRIRGCGIANPVQIVSVSGVRLSQGSTMTCETAQALNQWVEKGLKPAVGRLGGGAESLRVAAHYSCRTRNNKTGAKISEHGKGRAIDISAIKLQDGSSLSVLKDWGDGKKGRALKKAHSAACGPFGTVLGPNADRYHRDHFHFDTARHRSGPFCR